MIWSESWSQGCSTLSAATVLHSRIHICGIIIEDKYYRVQSERVLCICAGAKKLWNWAPAWSLTTAELSWKQRNHILPQASGDTQGKVQGRPIINTTLKMLKTNIEGLKHFHPGSSGSSGSWHPVAQPFFDSFITRWRRTAHAPSSLILCRITVSASIHYGRLPRLLQQWHQ